MLEELRSKFRKPNGKQRTRSNVLAHCLRFMHWYMVERPKELGAKPLSDAEREAIRRAQEK